MCLNILSIRRLLWPPGTASCLPGTARQHQVVSLPALDPEGKVLGLWPRGGVTWPCHFPEVSAFSNLSLGFSLQEG